MATECFCLSVDETSDELKSIRSLGEYVVEWRRKSGEVTDNEDNDEEIKISQQMDVFNVKSKIGLPEVKLETFPFLIEADMPTFGTLDKELRVSYVIKNKMSNHAIDLECMIDENEFFSISGKKFVCIFSI